MSTIVVRTALMLSVLAIIGASAMVGSERPATQAFASESMVVEVRTGPGEPWSQSAPGAWATANAAPGHIITGSALVRWTGPSGPAMTPAVRISVSREGDAPLPLAVTGMRLGETELTGAIEQACGGPATGWIPPGECPLTVVASIPAGSEGSLFALTVAFDPAAGNVFQGAALDGLRVSFEATSPPAPTGTATGAPPTPSAIPSPRPAALPPEDPAPSEAPAQPPSPGGMPGTSLPLPRPSLPISTATPTQGQPTPVAESTPPASPVPVSPQFPAPPDPPAAGTGSAPTGLPNHWPAAVFVAAIAAIVLVACARPRRPRE